MTHKLPETKLARSKVAGAAVLKLGTAHLGHKIKRPFLSKQKQQEKQEILDEKQAKLLFDTLAHLRGTALKLAQMLSLEVEILPAAFQQELEKSFHQVPPLNRVLVRKVLVDEFDQSEVQLFKKFDHPAVAAASLGQVHKAILADGTVVAVKIQYPGIHTAMESDMSLMQTLAKGMPNSKIFFDALKEVQARLTEEVDYRIEADNTRWFREHLKMEGVSVPRVYDQWSSQRVLTGDFIEGKHLDAWLADNPSQTLRDQLAQRLYDLFIVSLRELNCMHADPNPGNYLFHEDGSITLIDFGCVKHLSPVFVESHSQIIKAYYEDDHEGLYAAYKKIGMNYGEQSQKFYDEVLKPFGHWVSMILQQDSFDFGKHNDYTSTGNQAMQKLMKRSGVDNVTDDFVFFNRTIYGLCKMFERMRAKVRIRHYWVDDD